MTYLMLSGLIAFVFGIIVLVSPIFFKDFCAMVDKLVFELDALIKPYRIAIGLILLIVSFWIFFVIRRYPELWYLSAVAVIALLIGVLYLFFPRWLDRLSEVANILVFPTKEYVMGACKFVGVIMLAAGLYILVIWYLLLPRL
ncbi:MAG: hypothetical protein JW782_05885 [Candidatus Saganbacteria bacterium]|nr:hypothetical protein [Candidatus Saganbacteria bacterium]